jgi:hypothetical protein
MTIGETEYTPGEAATRQLFTQLKPGDRVAMKHEVKVGQKRWIAETSGTVVKTERRRQGLHFRRNPDDKVYADLIVLKRDSGELTTITIDEFSELRRA